MRAMDRPTLSTSGIHKRALKSLALATQVSSPAHIVGSELVEVFQIVTFGLIVFRIDGAGVDLLAITVNTRNNQKGDQAAYLYPMANVRSNACQ